MAKSYAMPVLSYFFTTYSCQVIFTIILPPICTFHNCLSVMIFDAHELVSQTAPLTLILLTWRKWWTPNNASKWQMGLNSAFKGLNIYCKKILDVYNKNFTCTSCFPHTRHNSCLSGTSFNDLLVTRLLRIAWRQSGGPRALSRHI